MPNEWNGGNSAQPNASYRKGYDVTTTDMQANQSGANAILSDGFDHSQIKLTVAMVETDLALAGSDGQSALQKDFYPRNFQQTSFTLTCQTRSQGEAGRLAEFIHKAQRHSISQGSLMKLIIPSGGLKKTRASINRDGMRGRRKGMLIDGYVKSIPRGHRRHDPAPVVVFDFVVANMHSGIFTDQPYKVYKLATWSEIVDAVIKQNFIKPSVLTPTQEDTADEFVNVVEWLGDLLD
jgi:hypothetical protein